MIYSDKTKNIQTGHAGPKTLTSAPPAKKNKEKNVTKLAELTFKTNRSQFTVKELTISYDKLCHTRQAFLAKPVFQHIIQLFDTFNSHTGDVFFATYTGNGGGGKIPPGSKSDAASER